MKISTTVLALFFAGTASAQDTILDTVAASENHTTLEAAVLAAPSEIGELLNSPDVNLTLFAPDDDAFGTLPNGTVDLLVTEPWQQHLGCVLQGHVHDAAVPSTAITETVTVPSLEEGYDLTLVPVGDGVTVNEIAVSGADIPASNGIIHSLSDGVLLPDCVTQNFLDVMASQPDTFSTLISLVEAAGLADAVTVPPAAEGTTVFAPTNDAFDKIPKNILDFLASNTTALTSVLTYHVVLSNEFYEDGGVSTTLNGEEVEVKADGDTVTVNDDATVQATVLASNGVIHVIDSVLVPSNLELPEAAPTTSPAPTTAPEPTTAPAPTADAGTDAPAPTSSGAVLSGFVASVCATLVSAFVF